MASALDCRRQLNVSGPSPRVGDARTCGPTGRVSVAVCVMVSLSLAGAVLGACGSSSPAQSASPVASPIAAVQPSVSPSPTVAQPSRQVLAILTKGSAAIAAAKRNPNTDAAFRSMARTLTTAAARLRALSYPAADAADAKALERDLTKLGSESSMMVGQTDVSLEESLGAQIMSDEANETADRAALMQDLGLRKLPRL